MGGSVFFIAIVAILGLVLFFTVSPLFLIPAVVVVLVALFAGPAMATLSRSGTPSGPESGVPSTGEASYEPVAQPGDRPA